MRAERRFRAMGTDCHVLVHAADASASAFADLASERVELLEQSWSRFRADSELSRLNAAAGLGPVEVSADLLLLAQRMEQAWQLSDGLFDPTVLTAVRAHGYDADFTTVATRPAASVVDVIPRAAPGMTDVRIDATASTVSLPSGVGIDPGAIGKGLAADIVAKELSAAGAHGALVNLGGDVSIAGHADGAWAIGVEDERVPKDHPARMLRILEFPAGTHRLGVATSTTLKRRWAQGRRHHVIDPRTGSMSSSDLVQATVVAATAWEAEILATTALLMPLDTAEPWLRDRNVTGILLTESAERHTDEESNRG